MLIYFLAFKMENVVSNEADVLELVIIMQHFNTSHTLASAPRNILMSISTYAQPWIESASDTIFLFGGAGEYGKPLSSSTRFNVNKSERITLAVMPCLRYGAVAAIHSLTSQIFVCGGFGTFGNNGDEDSGGVLSTMDRYSITSDTWVSTPSAPSMRFARYCHTAVEWNGFIFVIGGSDGDKTHRSTSSCEIFDVAKNTWSDLPNMSAARREHSSVVDTVSISRGYVYAIGGRDEKSVEKYDIVSKKWSNIASLSQCRWHHGSVVLRTTFNDRSTILAIGGYESGEGKEAKASSLVEQYTVNNNDDKWIIASWALPEPRIRFSAHVLSNGDLLLYGGYNYNGQGNLMSRLHIKLSRQSDIAPQWRCRSIGSYYDVPFDRHGMAAC